MSSTALLISSNRKFTLSWVAAAAVWAAVARITSAFAEKMICQVYLLAAQNAYADLAILTNSDLDYTSEVV
jgi:hypothetical protein